MEFLLDLVHRQGHHKWPPGIRSCVWKPSTQSLAESLAASHGPSAAECIARDTNAPQYGLSVLARTTTSPPGDWLQRIRLYREGLASGQWGLPLRLQQYAAQDKSGERFQCPVTVIYGLLDVALDPRIALDGIEKFFMPCTEQSEAVGKGHSSTSTTASHVIRLTRCGHWSLLEGDIGSGTLSTTLDWLIRLHGGGKVSDDLQQVLERYNKGYRDVAVCTQISQ
jgi:hypothetical protein